MYMCVYIYIYRERERYIHIYTHIPQRQVMFQSTLGQPKAAALKTTPGTYLMCLFALTRRRFLGPDGTALRGALEARGP